MSGFALSSDLSRSQTLRSLAELDTSVDAALDDLVRLAAHALNCPVVAVCLADEDRHWVKASFGLQMHPALNNPRFHLETIRERDLVVVTDAQLDPRFVDDPAVAQGNGVRFYAGAPLRVDGHVVGTLCLSGPEPRALSSTERGVLTDLAHAIEHRFISRREQLRLQAREREFRELAEQLPGIVYRAATDACHSTLFVSSRVRELGYSPEEWMSSTRTWVDALHPADRERALSELAKGIDQRAAFELNYRLRHRNGEWRHFHDFVRIVTPSECDVPVVQGVMLDVTDRVVAQVARDMVLNDLPDGVLLLDERLRITESNEEAQRLLGKSREALKGRHMGNLFNPGGNEALSEHAFSALAGGADTVEWDYWHPDGRVRTIEDRRRVVDGGAQVRVLRDVSHRRRETGWLRMLAQAAEQASEAIVITDLAANIVYVNQAMSKASGYAASELIGQNSRILQSGLTPAARYRKLWDALTAGRTWRGFMNNRRKDGSHYIEFSVISPVRDENGKTTHYLAVKEDITEKRRMGEDLARYRTHLDELVAQRTEELERAKRSAEHASTAKSAFLASMSHEIRTPMNGVIGIADVLRRSSLSAHQTELVETIQESAGVLLSLIDEILDFSKIEAGRLELHAEPFSLRHVMERACDAVQSVATERGVRLHVFVDPTLPTRWMGDAARVRQVVLNLLGNAIKFSAGLERVGRVGLRAVLAPGGGLRIEVRDNGIGISAEAQQQIFQPFVQGEESISGQYGGTGLGLAICRRLVSAMGGHIGVTSTKGVGTTFSVDLSLRSLVDVPVCERDRDNDLQGLHCQFQVGSEEPTSDWCAYLEAAGATTVTAHSGQAALVAGVVPVLFTAEEGDVLQGGLFDGRPHVRLGAGARATPEVLSDGSVRLQTNGMHRGDLLLAVALAAGRARLASQASAPAVQTPDLAPLVTDGRLVLVAEDNEINQTVIHQQLSLLGVRCEVVDDGAVALDRWHLHPERYALVLTDLRMPGLDGMALTRAIRESGSPYRRIPVLALTANVLGGEGRRCLEAGMNGYLSKPTTLEQLRAALHEVLSGAGGALPTVTASPASPHMEFDDDMLVRLVGDDAPVLSELRQRFSMSAFKALDEIRQAADLGAWTLVGQVAHRVKSSARSTGATGLGLLLDALETAVREGQTDRAQECVTAMDAAVAAVHRHFAGLAKVPRPVVLGMMCVDDEPQETQRLLQLASAAGWPTPLVFNHGADLLARLQDIDSVGQLLLIDLMMPEMDGVELIRHLGERRFAGGVALVGGGESTVVETAVHLLRAHGMLYLGHSSKPLTRDQLTALLEDWQQRHPAV